MSDVKITVEEASRRSSMRGTALNEGRLSMSAILRLKFGKLSPGS